MLGDHLAVDRVDVLGAPVDFNVGAEVEVGDRRFHDLDSGADVVNPLVSPGVHQVDDPVVLLRV